MKVIVVDSYDEMSLEAAKIVNKQIIDNPYSVLGLATGGTPEGMYKELIDSYKDKHNNIDWSKITTFNLDEYIGIPENHTLSYHTYMYENLFKGINVKLENTHIPNGNGNIEQNAQSYEKAIKEAGGIDLQILGIGENAHIGFNEPGSPEDSRTREVELTDSTINANVRYFNNVNEVPKTAISLGIGTILEAKRILLLASGTKKAQAIKDTIEGQISPLVPSSFLQKHPHVTLIIDKAAAIKLKTLGIRV